MTTITFDTLQFSKKLQSKGFKSEQADAISETLQDVINVAEVATKNDLNKLELQLKAEMSVIKWMVGVASAGIASLVLKSFF
jgi:hypothetical protein